MRESGWSWEKVCVFIDKFTHNTLTYTTHTDIHAYMLCLYECESHNRFMCFVLLAMTTFSAAPTLKLVNPFFLFQLPRFSRDSTAEISLHFPYVQYQFTHRSLMLNKEFIQNAGFQLNEFWFKATFSWTFDDDDDDKSKVQEQVINVRKTEIGLYIEK